MISDSVMIDFIGEGGLIPNTACGTMGAMESEVYSIKVSTTGD